MKPVCTRCAPGTVPSSGIDALPAVQRAEASRALIDKASKAMLAREGAKCLAHLDDAKRLDPITGSGLTTMRASCEMLAGQCERGVQRLRSEPNLSGASGNALADHMRATFCPVESKGQSPAERLKAIGLQAGAPPFSAARCEQFNAQTNQAIKDHADKAADATQVAIARSGGLRCHETC